MKVKIIEIDGRRVNLEDAVGVSKWVDLAEWVKSSFVKLGNAEITIKEDLVTFLKMTESKSTFEKPAKKFGENFDETPKNEERKFYKTKHIVVENLTKEELRVALDNACANHWVIATQTHFVNGKWSAVIYYKVKPE